MRLKLKEEPFQVIDPVSEGDIDIMQRHLRELFPTLDTGKLQKVHTSKNQEYVQWVSDHCRERHYIFQIRKCQNPACCSPSKSDQIAWLPDPMLDDSGEHYLKYETVKNMDTTELARPSIKAKNPQNQKGKKRQTTPNVCEGNESEYYSHLYTTQNARAYVECIECRKPRVVYSKHRLTGRQKTSLAADLNESDFTCGTVDVKEPTFALDVKCRPLECATTVEICYYGASLGPVDICCHCGSSGAEVDQELKKSYKTVLPICDLCLGNGKQTIVHRPYGKNTTK